MAQVIFFPNLKNDSINIEQNKEQGLFNEKTTHGIGTYHYRFIEEETLISRFMVKTMQDALLHFFS